MNLILNKLYYYYHTIKYLHFKQIIFHIYYKIKRKFIRIFPSFYYNRLQSKYSTSLPLKYNRKLKNPFILNKNVIKNVNFDIDDILQNKFKFLNIYKDLGENIDWNSFDLNKGTRLWKLNLNYQEYLVDVGSKYIKTNDEKYIDYIIQHMKSWINGNPMGAKDFHKDNWNSYAISNRIISWIKVFPIIENRVQSNLILNNLRIQLEYLYRNLEYDLRANHLLENGFALLFGAYFFNDIRIFIKAEKILKEQINEQILNDGYHIELSPMYQQHIIHRLIDSYNLILNNLNSIFSGYDIPANNSDFISRETYLLNSIKSTSEMMLSCINEITFNNGDIPLLNDSAFNIYPTTKELIDYAKVLDLNKIPIQLDESGYRKFENKYYECIMNVGGIKAHYMPGHAHSDILSFVLYINSQPFIIDTGVSTYDFSEQRILERSTKSHNTVQIDNFEQLEVWSSFRVANRVNAEILYDSVDRIEAILDYKAIKSKHNRCFKFEERFFKIIDAVSSYYKSKAYLHFHPSISLKIENNIIITNLCDIEILGSNNLYVEDYMYAPEFNKLEKSKVVIIEFINKLETKIKII